MPANTGVRRVLIDEDLLQPLGSDAGENCRPFAEQKPGTVECHRSVTTSPVKNRSAIQRRPHGDCRGSREIRTGLDGSPWNRSDYLRIMKVDVLGLGTKASSGSGSLASTRTVNRARRAELLPPPLRSTTSSSARSIGRPFQDLTSTPATKLFRTFFVQPWLRGSHEVFVLTTFKAFLYLKLQECDLIGNTKSS